MSYKATVILILMSLISFNQAQQCEIPSDLLLPCHSFGYQQGFEIRDEESCDIREKRQQKMNLGQKIESLRRVCGNQVGIPLKDIPQDLLNEENPSRKVKCVMACILQRLQLMTKSNLISTKGIEKMADEIGDYNPLITAIAIALAEGFNDRLTAMRVTDPCEAGFLINQYIAHEMRKRKIDVPF